jgi:UDP-3-O-[3-hydroxymyristoyl] glucosamine N-acyltransferase
MAGGRREITLASLARRLGGEVEGDGATVLTGVASLRSAGPADLSFLAGRRYAALLAESRAGAVVCPAGFEAPGRNLLRVDNPALSFGRAIEILVPPRSSGVPGVHPTAVVGEGVETGEDVSIGPCACIGDRCRLGRGVVIGPLVAVGAGTEIGEGTRIEARVAIYPGVRIGRRCHIHSGAVLGSDGFGFARDPEGRHRKIPQVGGLEIGDDVEIGSNCAIDRGSLDDTVIGRGTKLDNLVHVAHNVCVGEDSLLIAQVGISGSTRVGSRVVLAGQAGLVGHIEVGDDAVVGAQAGVIRSVAAGEVVSGYPARPHRKALKSQVYVVKLPEMAEQIRRLEERLARIESERAGADVPDDRGEEE